jgi:hypothetical protein
MGVTLFIRGCLLLPRHLWVSRINVPRNLWVSRINVNGPVIYGCPELTIYGCPELTLMAS